jgi:predicted HTH domain antitoxin
VQVHGGMGFVEETGAAQFMRDARIAAIYEGTNGIQAIDLVTRKLPLSGGETARRVIADIGATADEVARRNAPEFGRMAERLRAANESLGRATEFLLRKLGLQQPPNGTAIDENGAVAVAQRLGYPVLVRPSYVLGGRAMEIIYAEEDLRRYMRQHAHALTPDRPVLVDRFLEDATEVDVDCISDGEDSVIGAIMEHIEQAGIHSGDSACVIPPFSLSESVLKTIATATKAMAKELDVRGLMNVQFAVKGDDVYVLEVNPRASRTVPFVSKAIGVPLAKLAAKVMTGKTLRELGYSDEEIRQDIPVLLVLRRFRQGAISSGKAASLLGMSRRDFLDLLSVEGIPLYDPSDSELEEEMRHLFEALTS